MVTMANQNTGPHTTIVIDLRKKNKSKRKGRRYSEGIQSLEMSEAALTRAAERFSTAISEGLREYRRSRDRSSTAKEDGIIVDCVPNIGRGISEGMRVASSIPYDLARAINHREFEGGVRYVNRMLTSIKFTNP
jgi:hypothetical protein